MSEELEQEKKTMKPDLFFTSSQSIMVIGIIGILGFLFTMNGTVSSMLTTLNMLVSNQGNYVTKDVADVNRKARDKEIADLKTDQQRMDMRVSDLERKKR